MEKQHYRTNIKVNVIPEDAFNGINSVTKWWTENMEGRSQKQDDEFTVWFGETFITIDVVELVPFKKIRWYVSDCHKHWLKDHKEWKGSTITWDISTKKNGTEIDVTHIGLIPELECFDVCSNAWNQYIGQSLRGLLETGKGQPEKRENAAAKAKL